MKYPRLTLFVVASLLASALYLPAMGTDAQTPYTVLGYVYDSESVGIMGATVFVNNTRNGVSVSNVTDALGRFSADFVIQSNGVLENDVLMITAVYSGHRAYDNLTVIPAPYQQVDLALEIRTHVIDGYVRRAVDGTAAFYYGVSVRNLDTNESMICWTDRNGYYRKELSTYPCGFSQGDEIRASVSQAGFYGERYVAVSSGPRDWLNVTIHDVTDPVFKDGEIYEAPGTVSLGQEFRILAWVTDNHILASVVLYMKKEGDAHYSAFNMIRDNGGANDWNGNGMPDYYMWGQSTARDIPVQAALGNLQFYVEAIDATGKNATVPSSGHLSDPYLIEVVDDTMPTLSHTPLTQIEAGQPTEVLATAFDNLADGVDRVSLFYRSVGEPAFTKLPMDYTGDPQTYGTSIPAQISLGTLRYYLTCNDTSNNTARLPLAGEWEVNVTDTTAPKITHTKINSAYRNETINVTCRVSDAVLDSVWLNYTNVDGITGGNGSMSKGTEDRYHMEVPGQSELGIFHYTIWANDTSGNIAKVSHAFLILDGDSPMILHEPPEFIEFGQATTFLAHVMDDVNISSVSLAYLPEGGSVENLEMNNTDTEINIQSGNYSVEVPAQAWFGTMRYVINATDNSSNGISWPSIGPWYEVEVLDTIPPMISVPIYEGEYPSSLGASVMINVTDADSVTSAKLYYLNSTATSWAWIEMTSGDSVTFEGTIPPHPPGQVKFYIAAADPSNNTATLPAATPKLNPFTVNFTDDRPPELEMALPDSMAVNSTAEVFINATDDTLVTSVELYFKGVLDTSFRKMDVSKTGAAAYRVTLPAQMASGLVELYATATDGKNTNQTATANISVVNSPPTIMHDPIGSIPVGEPFTISATVIDDLAVEKVDLEWRIPEGQLSVQAMQRRQGGFYRINITFSDPVTVQYRIVAYDGETNSTCPASGFHELLIIDAEPPIITHQPISDFNTSSPPTISATVADNKAVASVTLWYKNETTVTFQSRAMAKIGSTDDYAVTLGRQPAGNFTYYIEASDGFNTARSPALGNHTAVVESAGEEVTSPSNFTWLFILIAVSLILILLFAYLYRRSKSIKESADSGDDRIEDDEVA